MYLSRMLHTPLKPRVPEDDTNYSGPKLSVSPEESQITNIPYRVLCEVFQDAACLVTSGCDIFPVPGECSQTLYNVSNKGGPPHNVKIASSGFGFVQHASLVERTVPDTTHSNYVVTVWH